ncbi:hypothetical protein [Sphingomonas sp. Root241]|uniref:hypothetical protein n=1 Tax=Sphingomonas sp. Root241 TaxID=1736501 RepID=UPI0006FB1F86|nr:hypothetical protein [Sphingomonas sp. Root241]KRC82578.1 hypothetical protein ASE13_10000 [Sphingomonas sp. Root241]
MTGPTVVREEIARYPCVGDDETPLVVIEYRLVELHTSDGAVRRRLGPRGVRLQFGDELRIIDARTFEMPATGELIQRVD